MLPAICCQIQWLFHQLRLGISTEPPPRSTSRLYPIPSATGPTMERLGPSTVPSTYRDPSPPLLTCVSTGTMTQAAPRRLPSPHPTCLTLQPALEPLLVSGMLAPLRKFLPFLELRQLLKLLMVHGISSVISEQEQFCSLRVQGSAGSPAWWRWSSPVTSPANAGGSSVSILLPSCPQHGAFIPTISRW